MIFSLILTFFRLQMFAFISWRNLMLLIRHGADVTRFRRTRSSNFVENHKRVRFETKTLKVHEERLPTQHHDCSEMERQVLELQREAEATERWCVAQKVLGEDFQERNSLATRRINACALSRPLEVKQSNQLFVSPTVRWNCLQHKQIKNCSFVSPDDNSRLLFVCRAPRPPPPARTIESSFIISSCDQATGHNANKQTIFYSDEGKKKQKSARKAENDVRSGLLLFALLLSFLSGNQAQIISEFNWVNSSETKWKTRQNSIRFPAPALTLLFFLDFQGLIKYWNGFSLTRLECGHRQRQISSSLHYCEAIEMSSYLKHSFHLLLRHDVDLNCFAQPSPQPVTVPNVIAVAGQRIALGGYAAHKTSRAHCVPRTGVRVENVGSEARQFVVN